MDYKQIYYPESRFGGFTNLDGTIAFYTRINALIDPSYTVLDIGCGRGSYGEDPVKLRRDLHILRGKGKKIIGIDLDENAKVNPYLDEFQLIKNNHWPVENSSVDLGVADFVLEHVGDPDSFGQRLLANESPASDAQIAAFERNQVLQQAIFDVGRQAAQFTLDDALSRLSTDAEIAIFEAEAAFAKFNDELERLRTLDPELFGARQKEAQAEQERVLAEIEQRNQNAINLANLGNRAQLSLLDRQALAQTRRQRLQQNFQREQNELDRALRSDELAEATRAARALEDIQSERIDLEQQQFKLQIFSTIVASPQLLFFLGEQGIEEFGGLLGEEGDEVIRELIAGIGEQGPGANIQEFSRLSAGEQGTESFRISALTGTAPQDVGSLLQSSAPTSATPTSLNRIRLGR